MHGSRTWRQRARKAYVAHLNCRFRLGVGSTCVLSGRFYSFGRSRKGRWPRATGLASYLSSRLCLFFAAAHVPAFPSREGGVHGVVAGKCGGWAILRVGPFQVFCGSVCWGANEVSCQARPALSSFGVFVPGPSSPVWGKSGRWAVSFLLLPLLVSSVIIPETLQCCGRCSRRTGRSALIVHPQERPLLGRAGSR
jgi:hypothetical protein